MGKKINTLSPSQVEWYHRAKQDATELLRDWTLPVYGEKAIADARTACQPLPKAPTVQTLADGSGEAPWPNEYARAGRPFGGITVPDVPATAASRKANDLDNLAAWFALADLPPERHRGQYSNLARQLQSPPARGILREWLILDLLDLKKGASA
jgi:hypothetical protein